MTRVELLERRVRTWAAEGRIADVPRFLARHRMEVALSDLCGGDRRALVRRALAANLLVRHAADRLFLALLEAGVPALPLKGIDVIERLYRGCEERRTTGDIDLLVREEDLPKALAVVERLGFRHHAEETREAQERWSKDVVFRDANGMALDVHRELMIDLGFTRTWAELEAAGALEEGPRLTLEALAIYLLVHMAAHGFGGESLRWVMDIAVLLDEHEAELDPHRLVALAERLRGRRAAGATVGAIARLLPDADLGPLDALRMRDLRERAALALLDLERVALHGRSSVPKGRSVAARALLEPGGLALAEFVYRKLRVRRSRRHGSLA